MDVVDQPKTPDAFPGLYAINLPRRCWTDDKMRVVMSTIWGSKSVTVRYLMDSSSCFEPDLCRKSWSPRRTLEMSRRSLTMVSGREFGSYAKNGMGCFFFRSKPRIVGHLGRVSRRHPGHVQRSKQTTSAALRHITSSR